MKVKATIMTEEDIHRTLVRLSHQIIEKNHGIENICLLGIETRGVPLANRICDNIEKIEGVRVPVGKINISLYRDDISKIVEKPAPSEQTLPFSVVGKTVILIDDVIFTGRTARAAMEAVCAIGRPARIQLMALIDRGHAELPIKANFVGKNIPSSLNEIIEVRLSETDGVNEVVINEAEH